MLSDRTWVYVSGSSSSPPAYITERRLDVLEMALPGRLMLPPGGIPACLTSAKMFAVTPRVIFCDWVGLATVMRLDLEVVSVDDVLIPYGALDLPPGTTANSAKGAVIRTAYGFVNIHNFAREAGL